MTFSQKTAFRLFTLTVGLAILYALAALLGAVKFLSPDDALALSLSYNQIGALTNILLHLAVMSGLLGGGVYIAVAESTSAKVANENLLRYGVWLWLAVVALGVLAGLVAFTEGRYGLELPAQLKVAEGAALVLLVWAVIGTAPRAPVVQIWAIGMVVILLGLAVSGIAPADYLQDRMWRALATGLIGKIGQPLAALALGYWLMHRFSNITPVWRDRSIYSGAGMATLAGTLVIVPPLLIIGAPEWAGTLGNIAVFAIPALYLVIAAQGYRALSDRNPNGTLAAHWFALSLLLYLLGIGLLGGIQSTPGVVIYTLGTRLTDLQVTLTGLAALAMALGLVNQGMAELRGKTRRVTGLMPFWLVAFGIVGGGLALAGAGLVQVFLERRLSVGYLDVQTLIAPLYAGWVFGLGSLLAGLLIYVMAFWLRRPTR